MIRKSLLLALTMSLVHITASPTCAAHQKGDETQRIAKVKADVAKRGVGEKARIKVKLQNKTEVQGYVSKASEDGFVVADAKTGSTTDIAYRDVAQVKGKGLSLAVKIGIGVGIAVVAIGILIAAAAHSLDNIGK